MSAAIVSFYVAIGANLPSSYGTPLQCCEQAVRWLKDLPGLHATARSRWFSTAPMPPSRQARFINGVVRLVGQVPPETLLAALQALEARAGRTRGPANAARPLDLDIIDAGGQVRTTPDPILPHPRAHERAFVLLPLRDVAPNWIHPATGVTIHALIAALPPQDIYPL
jgi:2-amino-4-hydroxy-6-hydroxymethyldihydropteridine diphosphokinase